MTSPRILLILARNRLSRAFTSGLAWPILALLGWVALIAIASLTGSH